MCSCTCVCPVFLEYLVSWNIGGIPRRSQTFPSLFLHVFTWYLVSWDTWNIPGWSQVCPCLSPYLRILRYPGMLPDLSNFVPTCIPKILSTLGYLGYTGMVLGYLVSWDTWNILGWSQVRQCLSPYPTILSILDNWDIPGCSQIYPSLFLHVFQRYLVSWDTWGITGAWSPGSRPFAGCQWPSLGINLTSSVCARAVKQVVQS